MRPEWAAVVVAFFALVVAIAALWTSFQNSFLSLLASRRQTAIDEILSFCEEWDKWAHGRPDDETCNPAHVTGSFSRYTPGARSKSLEKSLTRHILRAHQYRLLRLSTIEAAETFHGLAYHVYYNSSRLTGYSQIMKVDRLSLRLSELLDEEVGRFVAFRPVWDSLFLKDKVGEYRRRALAQMKIQRRLARSPEVGDHELVPRPWSIPFFLLCPNEEITREEFARVHRFMQEETPLGDEEVRDSRLIAIRRRLIHITDGIPEDLFGFLSERRIWESASRLARAEKMVATWRSSPFSSAEYLSQYRSGAPEWSIFLEDDVPRFLADMRVACRESMRDRLRGESPWKSVYPLTPSEQGLSGLQQFYRSVSQDLPEAAETVAELEDPRVRYQAGTERKLAYAKDSYRRLELAAALAERLVDEAQKPSPSPTEIKAWLRASIHTLEPV